MNKHFLRVLVLATMVLSALLIDTGSASATGSKESCAFRDRGYCVPGYISSDTWWMPAPKHSYGKAVWYAPYLMEATAKWRGMSLEGFAGGVAMMSPADIGQTVWIKRDGQKGWDGPFLVVDVSSRHHMYVTVEKIGEVIEVDYQTAVAWGMVDDSGDGTGTSGYTINSYMQYVEVYKGLHPPWIPTSDAVDYVEYFRENLAWGNGVYRRWSTDDITIANYAEYQHALATLLMIDSFDTFISYRENGNAVEEVASARKVLDSSISISDAHHYTQDYLETVEVVDQVDWEINCEDENPYNGFIFIDQCVPGVISRESWLFRYPKHTIGVATYYYPGVMDRVLINRGLSLDGYVDGVVMMTCAHVGESVWIRRSGLGWEGPYLVVDCGGPHGVWTFASEYKLHIEVDYDRWMLWEESTGHQGIELCIGHPSGCGGEATTWYAYWLNAVEWLLPVEGDDVIRSDELGG